MDVVTVSPKFQIVIPRAIREELGLKPGEKMRVFRYGAGIELIRVKPMKQMRGFAKGMDTRVVREPDRI